MNLVSGVPDIFRLEFCLRTIDQFGLVLVVQEYMQVTFAFEPKGDIGVTIDVYNMHGERISKVTKNISMSDSKVIWDVRAIAPGIYLYRIEQSGKFDRCGKLCVVH